MIRGWWSAIVLSFAVVRGWWSAIVLSFLSFAVVRGWWSAIVLSFLSFAVVKGWWSAIVLSFAVVRGWLSAIVLSFAVVRGWWSAIVLSCWWSILHEFFRRTLSRSFRENDIFTERIVGSAPFHPLVSNLQRRHFDGEGYRLHPFSSSCFISSKTAFSLRGLPAPPLSSSCFISSTTACSPRGLPAPPLFILLFHIFQNGISTQSVTGSTPFHPLVSFLLKGHFHREGYRLQPFSSSCFISSKTTFSPRRLPAPPLFILLFHIFKTAFSPRGLPAPPLFLLLFQILKNDIFTESVTGSAPFHPLVSYLEKRHFHREGYRLHPFSSSCFISSKTTFSPRGLPAPPLFILLFHIFKDDIFTKRATGSTPFHPLVSYLPKRHFHPEGYWLHPFSSSCFISSKTTFSPRGLPAHIFKNIQEWHFHPEGYRLHPFSCFTERVTGSTPFHPLALYLPKRRFHPECDRLQPFSSSCFISAKTTLSPRGLPAPPLLSLLFHIFKKRHFHEDGCRLHPCSASCFKSSKTTFSSRGLPAPPLFILLFHIFKTVKNGIFTQMVTSSTPFHPLVSYLQQRHFHPEGYRLHPFPSSCFTETFAGSTPFHPLVSYLQKRHFHREGYRLHPFSSSCFISSKTTFSPKGLPAPPLFILLFHIFQKGIFIQRVTGSTPFHPLVSYLQKRRFHREGYRRISSKTFKNGIFTQRVTGSTPFHPLVSPRGLPAPPLFILLLYIFQNDVFTQSVTGSNPFHPHVSFLQKRHFHREDYRLHPFSASCFISSKNDIFMKTVADSTPVPPLASNLQKQHFHREGYRLHPFSFSCFISSKQSKTAFSPRWLPAPPPFILLFHISNNGIFTQRVTGSTPFHPLVSPRHLPAPPLFILLFHIFKNSIFTERVTGSTPFHPLVSYLQKRRFHREGYRLHPFSSSCFISFKTTLSPRGLPAPPLFILLFQIFKDGILTERVTGFTPFHPLVSYLQKKAFSPRGLRAPPFFILLFHIFKNGIFTETVTGSTPFYPLVSYLQRRHFHREGYRLHPFSSSCFISLKTTFSPRGLPAPPLFILMFHIFKNDVFTARVTGSTPFHPLASYLQKRHFLREVRVTGSTPFHPLFHIFKNAFFYTEKVTGSIPFRILLSYLQQRHVH